MRGIQVGALLLLLAGCATPATDGSPTESLLPSAVPVSPEQSSTVPSPAASSLPSGDVSTPETVTVTFRLLLTGPVPEDAAFALESGIVGDGGGAIYLCSYYGGWPVCASGETYDEAYGFAPGTRVRYRFWRELDVNGTSEEIEAGELTVGLIDQVIPVSYAFQP
jgi:hypothetical protein